MYTLITFSLPLSTPHCKIPAGQSFSQVVRITFGSTDNVGHGLQFVAHVCCVSRLLHSFLTLSSGWLFYSQIVAFPLRHKIQKGLFSCLLVQLFPCLPSLAPDRRFGRSSLEVKCQNKYWVNLARHLANRTSICEIFNQCGL